MLPGEESGTGGGGGAGGHLRVGLLEDAETISKSVFQSFLFLGRDLSSHSHSYLRQS